MSFLIVLKENVGVVDKEFKLPSGIFIYVQLKRNSITSMRHNSNYHVVAWKHMENTECLNVRTANGNHLIKTEVQFLRNGPKGVAIFESKELGDVYDIYKVATGERFGKYTCWVYPGRSERLGLRNVFVLSEIESDRHYQGIVYGAPVRGRSPVYCRDFKSENLIIIGRQSMIGSVIKFQKTKKRDGCTVIHDYMREKAIYDFRVTQNEAEFCISVKHSGPNLFYHELFEIAPSNMNFQKYNLEHVWIRRDFSSRQWIFSEVQGLSKFDMQTYLRTERDKTISKRLEEDSSTDDGKFSDEDEELSVVALHQEPSEIPGRETPTIENAVQESKKRTFHELLLEIAANEEVMKIVQQRSAEAAKMLRAM